jgi:hypothetical protein
MAMDAQQKMRVHQASVLAVQPLYARHRMIANREVFVVPKPALVPIS